MILGIGTDLVELKRIVQVGEDALASKILTFSERAIYEKKKKKSEFLGGRFAAKEAISKAFGTGIGRFIAFQDIEILPNELGQPVVSIASIVWEKTERKPATIHLTITHSHEYAVAFAILEQRVWNE
ncbi:holo-ACP synthase [Risungbinella massiliensis]|uniref:holo-ACP synthase n=1 Tax=Risungbinella massiliensis TaxID=1329796 RepID=UPI0005CBAD0E|nr:holo-ACP synthase [Risungbinella massiliensis]